MSNDALNPQLEGMEQELRKAVPIAVYDVLRQSVEELRRQGLAAGLKTGDSAPGFALAGAVGQEVSLMAEVSKGPVVLVFYRGGWCPFCNMQLRAYERILPRIRALGASLIAVSPQRPDHTLSQQEKEQLTFTVVSDPDGRVAERYRVLYEVPEPLQRVLREFGGSLPEYNGTDKWLLPVPAVFVVDGRGMIRFAHVDADFMRRAEPERVLLALQALEAQ
ncbi:peroxiredoxin-like family protein [Paenibacillus glycinis]|uniref:thioredoxin-dependent peroxiredoxin n=1 Tax=Paenibacillus glycinis TaxID=2697035 RepID=A0ABW9XN24_9BACL|nr:peroxiredoxin-like family protein [Paenibacillus glycinis]NBD23787.1 redoxin domain-containing protein [Paenibacillus glycinis]